MRHILQCCDRTRLLWGSDVGFNFNDAIGYRLGLMDLLDIDDPARQAILCDNPLRLLPPQPRA
jgi:hypothetical protein